VLEDRLAEIPLFASLTKRERAQVARAADEVEVPEGKRLVEQGRFAYEFVAIEEGTAEVVQDGQTIAQLGPGDFFGEISLVSDVPRTATVKATSPVRTLVITDRSFRRLMNDQPEIQSKVLAALAARLAPEVV
jgi:CRP-like cAMP-binding protein